VVHADVGNELSSANSIKPRVRVDCRVKPGNDDMKEPDQDRAAL
jgi:hypothetical protein